MKIPKKVRIGCYDYDIALTSEPLLLDGRECSGIISYKENTIKIKRNGISEQQQAQTFWHEIVHAIIDYRQLDPQKADPETCVDEIALGLYGLMKNNPGMLFPGQEEK